MKLPTPLTYGDYYVLPLTDIPGKDYTAEIYFTGDDNRDLIFDFHQGYDLTARSFLQPELRSLREWWHVTDLQDALTALQPFFAARLSLCQ